MGMALFCISSMVDPFSAQRAPQGYSTRMRKLRVSHRTWLRLIIDERKK